MNEEEYPVVVRLGSGKKLEKASMRGSFQDAFIANYICSHVAATLPSGDIPYA
ncbi:unnamed protein product [Rhodiola kirilowii]